MLRAIDKYSGGVFNPDDVRILVAAFDGAWRSLTLARLPERRTGPTRGDMQLRSHLLVQARRRAGLRSFPGRPPAE